MTTKRSQSGLIGKYVLVGTERQVLAAGVLVAYDELTGTAHLSAAQQIVYWPAECRGAFGVAATGVPATGRVSPAAPFAVMRGVTGVLEATELARKTIEAAPWSR